MDRAAADQGHQRVAGLLDREALLDEVAVVGGHLDGAVVAEEVGHVQQEDVQRVALDPLAAVEQAAQLADRLGHLRRRMRPRSLAGAHLVGDRADAADAGGDVGQLGVGAAAQERLEEARRLEDVQLDVGDLALADPDEHRTLALDPGERVGLQDVVAGRQLVRHD